MSTNGVLELQKAIFSKLDGDATLTALATGGIHDHVSQDGTSFPHVAIGEHSATDDSTMGKAGQVVLNNIHIWSRYRGTKETRQIMERIYDLLHKSSLSVAGFSFAGMMHEFSSNVSLDPDGITRHGVMRFRTNINEV